MSDNPLDMNQIVSLIKAGEKLQAREQLLGILRQDPHNDQAWLYMAACARNKTEFAHSVQRALTLNPRNAQALRLAEQHGIDLPQAAAAPQRRNRRQKRQMKAQNRRGGSSRLRVIVLLLLIVLLAGAGALLVLMGGDDDSEAETEPIAEATAAATADATPEATTEATP
ncbi:MAG: hypothetical protein ACLFTK_11935, partial [Anaerolineales bacterium]